MKDMGISDVLAQMRALKAQAQYLQGDVKTVAKGEQEDKVDFSAMLNSQIKQVNEQMKESGKLQDDFVKGVPGITEVEVMIAMQKSSVAYQALNQVRNKLLTAYQEIMSMSV